MCKVNGNAHATSQVLVHIYSECVSGEIVWLVSHDTPMTWIQGGYEANLFAEVHTMEGYILTQHAVQMEMEEHIRIYLRRNWTGYEYC